MSHTFAGRMQWNALVFTVTCGLASSLFAAVVLDDTWTDGTRANQNLPAESAWYASTGAALTAAPNSMVLSMGSNAVLAITYFTADPTTPVQLGVGDTLTAAFTLTFNKVAPANKSQGFRLGLFNFARSTLTSGRLTADKFSSSSQGDGVPGYALFQNMGTTFDRPAPMELRKRTALGNSLLGTSDGWASLGRGPGGADGFSGFADGGPYLLQLSLQRTGTNSLVISATWSNTASGATLATTGTDNQADGFSFDGIALRPQGAGSVAAAITFNRLKVEVTTASSTGKKP